MKTTVDIPERGAQLHIGTTIRGMSDPYAAADELIARALDEDLAGHDDLTVASCVPAGSRLVARLVAKAAGVIAGIPLFARVCAAIDGGPVTVRPAVADGAAVEPGASVLEAEGDARTILIAERTALNLMQRLSGTATTTRAYVDAVAGTGARILDTRKTTPGLRALEKHAVLLGGGDNHRIGLYDQVLIKENHIALMGASGPAEAVRRCRERLDPEQLVEVEIERLDDLAAVIEAGADIVLLDNLGPEQLRAAVAIRGDRPVALEASGGITLASVRAVAETGVDRISIGALTHSVPALDLSLRCELPAAA